MAVLGEGVNDSEEFLIMDIPTFLCCLEFVVEEEKRVPAVVIFLFEDTSVGLVGGVGGEADDFAGKEGTQENVISNAGEDAVKSGLSLRGPFPWGVLFEKIS